MYRTSVVVDKNKTRLKGVNTKKMENAGYVIIHLLCPICRSTACVVLRYCCTLFTSASGSAVSSPSCLVSPLLHEILLLQIDSHSISVLQGVLDRPLCPSRNSNVSSMSSTRMQRRRSRIRRHVQRVSYGQAPISLVSLLPILLPLLLHCARAREGRARRSCVGGVKIAADASMGLTSTADSRLSDRSYRTAREIPLDRPLTMRRTLSPPRGYSHRPKEKY